jgi:hypothetical protein
MKRYFIFILLNLMACTERLAVEEDDINKYPKILPFLLLDHTDFEGEHFLDPGWLHFSYTSLMVNDPFIVIDSIARKEGWQIEKVSNFDRVYLEEIKSFPADDILDSLIVNYNKETKRVEFKWH